jgi:hypothetical protein
MVIFGKRTVNRKDMGAYIRTYGGRILLGFSSPPRNNKERNVCKNNTLSLRAFSRRETYNTFSYTNPLS